MAFINIYIYFFPIERRIRNIWIIIILAIKITSKLVLLVQNSTICRWCFRGHCRWLCRFLCCLCSSATHGGSLCFLIHLMSTSPPTSSRSSPVRWRGSTCSSFAMESLLFSQRAQFHVARRRRRHL